MPTTLEATSHHSSRKLSTLLPLRAIQNHSFHYETPCIYSLTFIHIFFYRSRVSNLSFDGSVSYENLNMDHISKLCTEGYSQSCVIRALGIARNDLAMARDILQEFSPTPSDSKNLSKTNQNCTMMDFTKKDSSPQKNQNYINHTYQLTF